MSTTPMKQEFFSIDESKRKKIVRQDRISVEPKTCFVQIEDKTFELLNISPFGCAALGLASDQQLLDKNKKYNSKLIFKNIDFQDVSLSLVRAEPNSESTFMSLAFEVNGEPINVERFEALSKADNVIKSLVEYNNTLETIPSTFRSLIYDLKDILMKLRSEVEKIENDYKFDNKQSNNDFESTVTQYIAYFLNQSVPQYYQKLPKIMDGLSKELKEICTQFSRDQIGAFIYGAPMASRAYFKPRGYAGDYEMMNQIYRQEPVGKTLFDKCMHKYFVNEPAAEAVKNRGQYLHKKIQQVVERADGKVKILSVASGPALEQQLFLQHSEKFKGREIEFTCIDQDEESLKHAQLKIKSIDRVINSGFQFNFKNLAIRNIIARGLPENDFDLIYSAGLFDYFSDPVVQVAGQKLFEGLKPSGELVIGNFSLDNPSTALMEMFLDWNLIYRSDLELERLFSHITKNIYVEKEFLGINLFACLKK